MVRKIVEIVPEDILEQDLEKYRQKAIKLGASDANIITIDMVIIDERVRAKCTYPKCEFYGTCTNCPPYSMEPEETRKMVSCFQYAIFYKLNVPTEVVAGKLTPEQKKQSLQFGKTRQEILAKVESEAFYDGYYLVVGFGGGSCKRLLGLDEDCRALKPGQGCKFSLLSRSSMEGVGMDVYCMATKVGWDIYPVGRAPSDAPQGRLAGIVFTY